MEKILLNASMREEKGKSQVKKVRKLGSVPGVCYKDGKESVNIKVNYKDLFKALHTKAGENALITLTIEGDSQKKPRTVMVKEVQTEPIDGEIIHVDFSEISLTKALKVKVPVVVQGEAKEIAREGGIVEHILWEVEVECLPAEIPEKIIVDISNLKIGDTIHLKDLAKKEGVKYLGDPDLVVVAGKMPAKEEEAAVAGAEGVEEPEVIAKGKKPEEGDEEGGEKAEASKKEEKKEEKKEDKK